MRKLKYKIKNKKPSCFHVSYYDPIYDTGHIEGYKQQ